MVSYNKVILEGGLPNAEVWSVGWAFATGTVPTGDYIDNYEQMLAWAEDVATYIETLPSSTDGLKALWSTQVNVRTVRVEARYNGELVQAAESELAPGTTGNGVQAMPNQTALVASLLTGRPGRSYRGRTYWPALANVLQPGTSGITTARAQIIATQTAAMLSAIADAAPEPGIVPVVASATANVVTLVTLVQIGTTLDTQRRRRDAIVETRVSAPLP